MNFFEMILPKGSVNQLEIYLITLSNYQSNQSAKKKPHKNKTKQKKHFFK